MGHTLQNFISILVITHISFPKISLNFLAIRAINIQYLTLQLEQFNVSCIGHGL